MQIHPGHTGCGAKIRGGAYCCRLPVPILLLAQHQAPKHRHDSATPNCDMKSCDHRICPPRLGQTSRVLALTVARTRRFRGKHKTAYSEQLFHKLDSSSPHQIVGIIYQPGVLSLKMQLGCEWSHYHYNFQSLFEFLASMIFCGSESCRGTACSLFIGFNFGAFGFQ